MGVESGLLFLYLLRQLGVAGLQGYKCLRCRRRAGTLRATTRELVLQFQDLRLENLREKKICVVCRIWCG